MINEFLWNPNKNDNLSLAVYSNHDANAGRIEFRQFHPQLLSFVHFHQTNCQGHFFFVQFPHLKRSMLFYFSRNRIIHACIGKVIRSARGTKSISVYSRIGQNCIFEMWIRSRKTHILSINAAKTSLKMIYAWKYMYICTLSSTAPNTIFNMIIIRSDSIH